MGGEGGGGVKFNTTVSAIGLGKNTLSQSTFW